MKILRRIHHLVRCGAGEGNRTLVLSLGSFSSAIELHPLGKCDILTENVRFGNQAMGLIAVSASRAAGTGR